jgi:hypothetical protein
LRFAHDMVCEFPSLLPRGVTVAQVTLDHFVMVRIHARQVVRNQHVRAKYRLRCELFAPVVRHSLL